MSVETRFGSIEVTAMLAAIPKDEWRHLQSFCLALRLVEQGHGNIPDHVADYFDEIVSQVRSMLQENGASRGVISPEALALLLEIRSEQHLRDVIGQLPRFNAIAPDIARTLLSDMEQRFALQE
jgi:hypothetical protein